MKQLWTGEEVTFEGRFWSVHGVRMGMTPVQKPHPPLWVGAHRVPASERAARVGDGLVFASQTSWQDVTTNTEAYHRELARVGRTGRMGRRGEAITFVTPAERAAAPVLHRALLAARDRWTAGERSGDALRGTMRKVLADEPLATPAYVSVADGTTLGELDRVIDGEPALLSLAVRFGSTRLIDNEPIG